MAALLAGLWAIAAADWWGSWSVANLGLLKAGWKVEQTVELLDSCLAAMWAVWKVPRRAATKELCWAVHLAPPMAVWWA